MTAISAGCAHTVALLDEGTLVARGWNDDGQANVPAGRAGVTAVAAGGGHTVGHGPTRAEAGRCLTALSYDASGNPTSMTESTGGHHDLDPWTAVGHRRIEPRRRRGRCPATTP